MRKSLKDQLKELKEIMANYRLEISYLKFDLEATRRERDYFKKELEGKK